MSDPITPAGDLFVLAHCGIPDINDTTWSLTIDGLVRKPLRLTLHDLKQLPPKQVEAVHQCAGNPLEPHIPARRVANVIWRGVDLRDVLAHCQPNDAASFLWSYGADYGDFAGFPCDFYLKDLPMDRVIRGDVLLAYEVNGAPIPRENGFPLRLVVPGFYGTNSVKWLYRLTLSDRRADAPFTTHFYNDQILDAGEGGHDQRRPVWGIAPESLIVAPAPGTTVKLGQAICIWGWAWSEHPLETVELSFDQGRSWTGAALYRRADWAWHRFNLDWTPIEPGRKAILARATDATGTVQPMHGYRNAVHSVEVCVDG
ncbi:molybdopterin-dependent oxidoreductase [Taklimakanibacter deserti]|uniref:molybdopterin-dependent oxidoreductase n=1 Tax=Taklimakanibacter deserti TaxID=2267839 RepID=UPI0013C3FC71